MIESFLNKWAKAHNVLIHRYHVTKHSIIVHEWGNDQKHIIRRPQ
jgi:c-di-AMP phosphodiesterase-like protein